MALAAGTKLGPYEIESPLGAGGMGEVYRARDTRLDRSVAVKILPERIAGQAGAEERFEREARTISALNHPYICQLYDVGTQDGMRYLVMELLEGETLAERLCRGPLPVEQAARYGSQMASGLDAAHRRGVVHRDLKPGNVMLTRSGAKLMDFGLAKDITGTKVSSGLTATLTSSTPLTAQGTIVGTFQYMSPEQLEGKEADARSDIFSLGSALYEMASGKRAFEGKSMVAVAAEILQKEPVMEAVPLPLARLIKKCLAKDPEERWQSAGDLASELTWIAEGGSSASAPAPQLSKRSRIATVFTWMTRVLLALAIVAIVVLSILLGFSGGNKPVIRTQIAPSEALQFNFVGDNGGPPEISPDGKRLVFSARSGGSTQLFLRSMDQLAAVPLGGTEDGTFPFWSPDSKSVAFFAGGKLKRIDIGGGPAVNICDAPLARGGAWSSKGMIALSPKPTLPLMQVPAGGGSPTPLTRLDAKYTTHRWPSFLPDGEHFLYLAANHMAPTNAETGVFWASLDGKQNKFLLHTVSNAIYASGYLLYVRDGALMAQPFDARTGDFQGDPKVINDDVQVDGAVWRGTFTVASDRLLVYQPGTSGASLRLTWVDRSGKETESLPNPDQYVEVQLSPDGKKAAVVVGEPVTGIWIYDLERKTRTRLSFGDGIYNSPVWSHDGKQIAYVNVAVGGTRDTVIVKAADGSGEEKQLMQMDSVQHEALQELWDWSPDGRYLLYNVGALGVGNGLEIWAAPLFGDRKPFLYAGGTGDQLFAQFSPDGRWVAYTSSETGQQEVYVAPFPATGAKWQVSTSGGRVPHWTRGGKEIVYQGSASPKTWAAAVDGSGSTFVVTEVKDLFVSGNLTPNNAAVAYSAAGDGQRFLQITTGETGKSPLTVVENWTEEVKRK